MKIAFNPSTVAALIAPPNNKDITFDLRGQNIFARGVKFCGTDTNTWRDIKINNVSIDSNILDLRDGDNTTLTNINGVVTINSTWRPVVDNLTSDSTTSSLSANLGRVLKALIDGKSDSDHNHDDRYLRLTGGLMLGDITFGGDNKIIWGRNTDSASISFKNDGDGDADSYMSFVTSDNGNEYFRWSHSSGSTNTEWMSLRSDGLRVGGTKVSLEGHSHDDRYVKRSGDTMLGALNFANGIWNLVGDDSYMGDCNVSGHFGIKAANTTYPGIAFFNNANAHLGNLTAYNGNIKYGAYSLQFLDNGNTSVSAGAWMNPFNTYDASAVADGQAVCVWGQSSYLSNLAADSGDMSLWLKRVNANVATLNMVLDGEYYANGNLRLAHVSEIPNSLKNPYALTISLNGTSQGPYDGSAAKNINITPSSIGAATSDHNHDGRYVYNYGGTQMDGASINKNALGMATNSGITEDWWHILQAAWNGEYRWNSLIAFPTLNRNGIYYRSGLDDNTAWGAWVKLLDTNNYSSILDSRYYTESEINTKLGEYLPLTGGTMIGSSYISFNSSANNTVLTDSTPTGLTYGRLQSYSTITICGDTDGSTTEYVNITAGYPVANATAANGLSIGYNTLKWKGSTIWHAGNDGSGSGLDADTVDGYHASSLWRSDGGIWNPGANISLTASGNGQEWSFDIYRNEYTDCYWHVWDSSLSTMLKVNADDGKVSAPYGFVGNLSGNATTSNASTATTYLIASSISDNNSGLPAVGDRMLLFRTSAASNGAVGGDGHILGFTWSGTGSYGALIYIDTDPTYNISIRQRDSSGNWIAWKQILTENNWSNWCAAASHTHPYLPLSGAYITGTNIADMKVNIRNYFNGKPAGTNCYVGSPNIIYNFLNDSAACDVNSVCGIMALNPGYDNYNHGHFLVSHYGDNRIGMIGLGYLTWYGPNWFAYTSDIPTVTDYYWANIKVSSSSNTTTTPTFGSLWINNSHFFKLSGTTFTCQGGTTFTLPSSSLNTNTALLWTTASDGARDTGIFYNSSDFAFIANSNDHGAVFAVYDTDVTQDFEAGAREISVPGSGGALWARGGFSKSGSSNDYVLLGGGGHKAESSLRVAYASSAGNADTVDGYHENSFLRYRGVTSTDLEATLWSLIGIKLYNNALPDNLTGVYNYGSVISLPGYSSRFEIYASHKSSSGNGLYYRSGWGSDKRTWLKFIDSSNIGSQSVNYANSAGYASSAGNAETLGGMPKNYGQNPFGTIPWIGDDGVMEIGRYIDYHYDNSGNYDFSTRLLASGNNRNVVTLPSESGTLALTSYGGDSSHPIFLGYLDLEHGNDGTISSSFYCLGYSVPFTYTRGGNYCRINIPDTTHQVFYIRAAIASVNYSGGGMDTWTGYRRGDGAWWLHCYAYSSNEVRVKGFRLANDTNDSWWGGNPLWSSNGGANKITVCIFGYVTFK